MRDDDGSDEGYTLGNDPADADMTLDLFGQYSVIAPGVHIVLEGRAVSRGNEAL